MTVQQSKLLKSQVRNIILNLVNSVATLGSVVAPEFDPVWLGTKLTTLASIHGIQISGYIRDYKSGLIRKSEMRKGLAKNAALGMVDLYGAMSTTYSVASFSRNKALKKLASIEHYVKSDAEVKDFQSWRQWSKQASKKFQFEKIKKTESFLAKQKEEVNLLRHEHTALEDSHKKVINILRAHGMGETSETTSLLVDYLKSESERKLEMFGEKLRKQNWKLEEDYNLFDLNRQRNLLLKQEERNTEAIGKLNAVKEELVQSPPDWSTRLKRPDTFFLTSPQRLQALAATDMAITTALSIQDLKNEK